MLYVQTNSSDDDIKHTGSSGKKYVEPDKPGNLLLTQGNKSLHYPQDPSFFIVQRSVQNRVQSK